MWVEEGRGRVMQFTGRCLSTESRSARRAGERKGSSLQASVGNCALTFVANQTVIWALHVDASPTLLRKRFVVAEMNNFGQNNTAHKS